VLGRRTPTEPVGVEGGGGYWVASSIPQTSTAEVSIRRLIDHHVQGIIEGGRALVEGPRVEQG